MDDQFDDSLRKHISKAFENIEVPTADEGWLMLRKKFPEKEKDRPVVWLWRVVATVAALIILALGIGTWVNNQNTDKEKIAHKPHKAEQFEKNNDKLAIEKTVPAPATESGTGFNNPSTKKITKQPVVEPHNTAPNSNQIAITNNADLKPAVDNVKDITNKPVLDNYANNNVPASVIPDNKINSNTSAITKDSTANIPGQNLAREKPVSPAVLPKTNSYSVQDNQPVEAIAVNNKKVKFGVYAATYFNYAKGSENQINMGVGFTSDIKISRKIKLSTGVAIAQNSLNYINQPSSGPQNLLFNATVSNNALGTANAYNFATAQSAPAIRDYNALLVGLDIPLNIKYEFNPQKSRSYIVVGLSSGTFINESYTYNFNPINTRNYALGATSFVNQQQQPGSQTTKNSFNDFYFARMLNVSFGIGYPLGKNHLIIEPFLKYPLSGLGAQQIRFGAGGINLKFDFQSSKK